MGLISQSKFSLLVYFDQNLDNQRFTRLIKWQLLNQIFWSDLTKITLTVRQNKIAAIDDCLLFYKKPLDILLSKHKYVRLNRLEYENAWETYRPKKV